VTVSELPAEAWASALAGLPAMGPARLRAVLATWPPEEAWARVAAGAACSRPAVTLACRPDPAEVAALWRMAARRVSVAEVWAGICGAGVTVSLPGTVGFPSELSADVDPPAVVFSKGDWSALAGRRVAIVGTRRCTRYGRDVAYELGRDLAAAGVRVVSGLALGIDGAAHRGRWPPPAGRRWRWWAAASMWCTRPATASCGSRWPAPASSSVKRPSAPAPNRGGSLFGIG
jgi:DNA processing protein